MARSAVFGPWNAGRTRGSARRCGSARSSRARRRACTRIASFHRFVEGWGLIGRSSTTWAPRRQPVGEPRDPGGRLGPEAVERVAPVHHARVGNRPERRRVAVARPEVEAHHGDGLGDRVDDEVAGQRAGRPPGARPRGRCSWRSSCGRWAGGTRRARSRPARRARPGRRARPRARRAAAGARGSRPSSGRPTPPSPGWPRRPARASRPPATRASPAARSRRAGAPATAGRRRCGRERERGHGDRPESSQLRSSQSVAEVGVLDQGAPVCAPWKSDGRDPRQVQQRGPPKAIAASAAAAGARRGGRRAARQRDRLGQGEEHEPVVRVGEQRASAAACSQTSRAAAPDERAARTTPATSSDSSATSAYIRVSCAW